ncbi:MAG: hypothetical protein Q8N51_04080 [Gammaproteobacteria bacterium]|nr:hypothetical protein [Gammaproteobacteria bacterium]
MSVQASTSDFWFPQVTINVTVEALFPVLTSAGHLGSRWKPIPTQPGNLTVKPMSNSIRKVGVNLSGKTLKQLADEGICSIRITFAGQNAGLPSAVVFEQPNPVTLTYKLNPDGTLSGAELLDLHGGNQRARGPGPSNN